MQRGAAAAERATGFRGEATAYWSVEPRRGELRREALGRPADGEALVRAVRSGVSRGTESLVHRGLVPEAVRELMRAPFQVGEFPGPVKYGYLSVGVVEDGPAPLRGRRVFCLHPHQDRYVVPAAALSVVPDEVPIDRAVLAGPVETAVNALWDAAPRFGDRVAVVGAGMIGASVATLLRRFPWTGCSSSTRTRSARLSRRHSGSTSSPRGRHRTDATSCSTARQASPAWRARSSSSGRRARSSSCPGAATTTRACPSGPSSTRGA
ncbi:MAG: hypothetical protein WCG47_02565 [Dermatophilaceae bacterium]